MKTKRIPKNITTRVDRARTTFLERNALAQVVAKQALVDETALNAELREFRNELVISRYFEAFLDKAVQDDNVREYYDDHTTDYQQKELKLAQIVFRIRPNMTEQEVNKVFRQAVKVHKQLTKGASFAQTAKKVSEDFGSKRRGGTLGWVRKGQIDSQLFEQAAKLKKNELSEPLRTTMGYYIIKLLAKPKVKQQPFETVKGQIRYQLRQEARQTEMTRLLGQIKISELEK